MLKKFYANFSAVLFLIIVICAVGLYQFFTLPIALYPKTSKPEIRVNVNPIGISAEDFYERYGKDIESKILSLKDVDDLTGEYSNKNSRWKVTFNWGYDEEKAITQLKSVLSGIEGQIPQEWGGLSFWAVQENRNDIIYSVHSDSLDQKELYAELKSQLKTKIDKIEGTEESFIVEPFSKEIRITLDQAKLSAWEIFPEDLKKALKPKIEDVALGRLDLKTAGKYSFYVATKTRSLEDIEHTFLKRVGKRDLYVKDIAKVEIINKSPDWVPKGNGKRGIIVGAKISDTGNIVEACHAVSDLLKKELPKISSEIEYEELVNPSTYIEEAVQNVWHEVLLGVLIATLVLFLFFGSLTYTSIISISIPLSLIGGFIVMKILGIEVNLVSLGALALAAGMVVDGSIVVLENIVRHFEISRPRNLKERIDITAKSVWEVREPVIVSLLTLIVVFAPLAFTSPLANAVLGDLAKVMVCVLFISIAVSIFIIPPLFIKMGKVSTDTEKLFKISRKAMSGLDSLKDKYVQSLEKVLKNTTLCRSFLIACLVLFLGALSIFAYVLKREILAKPYTDKIWFVVNLTDRDQEIDKVDAIVSVYEKKISEQFKEDITQFYTSIHDDGASILLNLKDKSKVDEFTERLEEAFPNTPQVQFYVHQWVPTSLKIPNPPLALVEVGGDSREEKRALLESLKDASYTVKGVDWFKEFPRSDLEEGFEVRLDKNLIHFYKQEYPDFSENKIYDLIRTTLKEQHIADTFLNSEKVPITMSFEERIWTSPEDIKNLYISLGDKKIPLRQFFTLVPEKTWNKIYTVRGQETVRGEVWAHNVSLSEKEDLKKSVMEAFEKKIPDTHLLNFLDTDKEINENILSLILALTISLLLVWLIVNLQFANFFQSLIVMMVIPLGFIGAAIALYITGTPLSINSMLGLILLCGLAVNHSILFVDFYNAQRKEGKDKESSILSAADLRFRPIMLTKMTTILGSLPIALTLGTGGEVLQALGITICGGLAISIPLTLYAIPMSLHLMKGK